MPAAASVDFGRKHQPISERRSQLEDELPRLQAERDILKINRLSQEEVLAEAGDLLGKWPEFSFKQRLQAAGKRPKVIIVALMRKLITILNAMLRDQTAWANP